MSQNENIFSFLGIWAHVWIYKHIANISNLNSFIIFYKCLFFVFVCVDISYVSLTHKHSSGTSFIEIQFFWLVLNLYYLLSVSFYLSYMFWSLNAIFIFWISFFAFLNIVNKWFVCVQSPFSFEIYFQILIVLFHYFPFQSPIHSLFYFTLLFAHPVLFFFNFWFKCSFEYIYFCLECSFTYIF